MSDEERRMIKENEERRKLEEKNKKEIEKSEKERREREEKDKNKVAEITRVEFLDKDGKEKNVFETGDELSIVIKFNRNKKDECVNFALGMHLESGGYVFGYNTKMDNFNIDSNATSVTMRIKKLPILKGKYFLNVVCFGNQENKFHDAKFKFRKIVVFSKGAKNRYAGICDIEHMWI
jgi:hypothetical protein